MVNLQNSKKAEEHDGKTPSTPQNVIVRLGQGQNALKSIELGVKSTKLRESGGTWRKIS